MIKQTVVLLRKFEENMDQSQTHLAVTSKIHVWVVFSDHQSFGLDLISDKYFTPPIPFWLYYR